MIDRGDIRQAIDRCGSTPGFTAGRWLVVVRLQGWQPDSQNSKKRAERSGSRCQQSHCDYLRSGVCIIVCCRAVNHYRDNAITPPSATKMPENWSHERGTYWHADASAWCYSRCKYTKELAYAKAEKWSCLRMMLPVVVVGCTSKQSVSQCVLTPASGVHGSLPPTGRHRWTGLFHLRERPITMQKQLKGTQKHINE